MKKAQWIGVLAIVLLFVSGGVAWSLLRTDPDLAKLRDLDNELRAAENMPQEERAQIYQQMRDVRDNLTEAQREVYGRERREEFKGRMQEQLNQYFSLSGNDRIAFLDQEIQRQETRRAEWEQRRRERESSGEARDNGGGRGGPGGPPWGGGARGGRRGSSSGLPDNERRMERRRRMLDATTPEERAKFTQFREDLQSRREQLGLPDTGWGRGHR